MRVEPSIAKSESCEEFIDSASTLVAPEMVEKEDLIDLRSYVVDGVEAVHCILEYGRDLRTTYHAHVLL